MATAQAESRSGFFGWHVVAAAFTYAIFAWGIGFYGLSVFLYAIHDARGWPLSLISAAITAHYLVSAALVACLDDAHRRFGLAATTRGGVLALAAGVLGWGLAAAPWELFVAATLTAIGWSATSSAAINAMLAPWFRRRRGLALSLAFNGASIGGVLFVPLWTVLIGRLGLPGAASAVAAVTLALLWWLAGRYLAPTPESMGLGADGDVASAGACAAAASADPVSRSTLFRHRGFLTLSGAFALGLFSQVGLVAILVSLLVPTLGEGGAAGAVSLTSSCAVLGRLLLGAFIDQLDRRRAAAGNFALQSAGLILLLLGKGSASVLSGCVLFGLGLGNLVSLPPLIAEREFATGDLGRVVALAIAVNQAFFSFAPAVFGALHDFSGGFAAPLMLALALHLTAAALILGGGKRVPV
ncbi:MAG TPA: MFS transporter [Stellaceae bacterium]|nr:MFS transporter [Stellaceae bacterium]